MKILSGAEGDGLLTNAEVLEWLREKNFEIQRRDVPDGVIKPPSSTAAIAKDVRQYLEASPSGAQTSKSACLLFAKLKKFKLSLPELMMIANIRPEAYAHLTPLIANVYSRFDEDQLYEILEIVNSTLEKRVKRKPSDESEPGRANQSPAAQSEEQPNKISRGLGVEESPDTAESEDVSAQITDMTTAVQSVRVEQQQGRETERMDQTLENGADATITDYSAYPASSTPDVGRQNKSQRRATR